MNVWCELWRKGKDNMRRGSKSEMRMRKKRERERERGGEREIYEKQEEADMMVGERGEMGQGIYRYKMGEYIWNEMERAPQSQRSTSRQTDNDNKYNIVTS